MVRRDMTDEEFVISTRVFSFVGAIASRFGEIGTQDLSWTCRDGCVYEPSSIRDRAFWDNIVASDIENRDRLFQWTWWRHLVEMYKEMPCPQFLAATAPPIHKCMALIKTIDEMDRLGPGSPYTVKYPHTVDWLKEPESSGGD